MLLIRHRYLRYLSFQSCAVPAAAVVHLCFRHLRQTRGRAEKESSLALVRA